jgi:hypothetical protein
LEPKGLAIQSNSNHQKMCLIQIAAILQSNQKSMQQREGISIPSVTKYGTQFTKHEEICQGAMD